MSWVGFCVVWGISFLLPFSLFAETSFQFVLEDFALSHQGNRLTDQASACFSPADKEETSLGLVSETGESALWVCNACRSGLYVFSPDRRSMKFYAGDRDNCPRQMEEIRENLTALRSTLVRIVANGRIRDLERGADLTPLLLEKMGSRGNVFSLENFQIVAGVLGGAKGVGKSSHKSLP